MFTFKKSKTYKTATKPSFFGRKTTTALPTPGPAAPITQAPASAPDYKFVDQQKTAIDTEAAKSSKVDETIERTEGRNATTDAAPVLTAQTNKGKGTERHTEPHTGQEAKIEDDSYRKFWHREIGYSLDPVYNSDYNEWTPNAEALFAAMRQSHHLVDQNRTITKNHPEYCDYSVACYYSIIFYMQILRARKAAGKLTGNDSSLLRRFDRSYPEESLPIAEPFYPILSSIVSTQMEDSKYDWTVPRIATENFRQTMAHFTNENGSCYLQPQVPYMLGILRHAFSNIHNTANHRYTDSDANGNPIYFDDEGRYIPIRIGTTQISPFGLNMTRGTAPAANFHGMSVFSACGTSYPFYMGVDEIGFAYPRWQRSTFMTLNFHGSTANNGITITTGTQPINDLEHFLMMPKTSDLAWFEELVNQAAVHARFWKKEFNMSDLPTTGGNETLILSRFKRTDPNNAQVAANYNSVRLDVDETNFNWYPTHFERMTAAFACTRADIQRSEELQALSFATNATLPIATTNAGNVLVGETHGDGAHRRGAFWTNKEWTYELYDFSPTSTNKGKPMFAGWTGMFQQDFHVVKPAQYK
nr:capsid protein [Sarcosphaera coronaria partitivirus]